MGPDPGAAYRCPPEAPAASPAAPPPAPLPDAHLSAQPRSHPVPVHAEDRPSRRPDRLTERVPQEPPVQYTSLLDSTPGSATSWPSPSATAEPDLSLPCQHPDHLDLWFAERGDDVERAKAL